MLFYHGYIEDALRQFDDSETDQITEQFVLEAIEEAAKSKEAETARMMGRQEEQFLNQLSETVSGAVIQKEREWLAAIHESKTAIRKHAEASTRKRLLWTKSVVAVALCIPSALLLALGDSGRAWQIIWVIGFGLGLLQFIVPRLWDNARKKWVNELYATRLKEARLDRFEGEGASDP